MTLDEARKAVPGPLRNLVPTDPSEATVFECHDPLGGPASVVMWLDSADQLRGHAPPAGVIFDPLTRRQFVLAAGHLSEHADKRR